MNIKVVSEFIKQLRTEKGWSQSVLAEKMNVDVSKINRIEKGTRYPNVDDLIILEKIFNVSFEELIAGCRLNNSNKNTIHKTIINYLKCQDNIIKKLRVAMILVVILFTVAVITISTIYFFQNYGSIRVYKFYGESDNYKVEDGLLILSKDKMYFQIGKISPYSDEITLYSEIDNDRKVIYQGNYDVIISDSYGYNSFISYKDFIHSKQNVYVKINNEEIQLNFVEDFVNDNIINAENSTIGIPSDKVSNVDDLLIKDKFTCDEQYNCSLEINGIHVSYNIGIFSVMEDNKLYSYDLLNQIINYTDLDNNRNYSFKIDNKNLICVSDNCYDYQKVFLEFEKKYIKEYLKI